MVFLDKIRLLLIEGTYAHKQTSFALALRRHYEVMTASTGKQATRLAEMIRPDVIILNAASMRTSGERICTALNDQLSDVPIIYIQKEQPDKTSNCVADITLKMPFTVRKLMNRIQRFVESEDTEILMVGPFQLQLNNLLLITPTEEKRLTPKMCTLLELFFRHPNEVLRRDYLMQKVWETDYMGDTRTLDVHIRWIREALEEKPSKPRFIVTERGVGYRFVIKAKPPRKRKN